MKIERTNKAFQPIELKITIETEEEKDNLRKMLKFGYSLSKTISSENFNSSIDEDIIGDFFQKLEVSLHVD